MTSLQLYLIKVSLITGILYLVFMLFFINTTFHRLNRFVLLSIIFFSIICPALQFHDIFNTPLKPAGLWLNELDEIPVGDTTDYTSFSSTRSVSVAQIILYIYFFVVLVLTARFIKQLRNLFELKRKSAPRIINDNSLLLTDKIHTPFSFFHWIFIPANYDWFKGINSVIKHEKTHALQYHSLDLLLAELYGIVFWFNPFVFLLKRSLKTVHEYLADNRVLHEGSSLSDYLIILKTGHELTSISGITNQFTSSTIKKRIKMITKNKTPRKYIFKYFALVLSAALLMFSFAKNPPSVTVPCIKPVADKNITKIASGYGMRMHPVYKEMKMHYGIDIVADKGTPVIATADGKVTKREFKEEGKGYGRVVIIQHSDEFSTLYAQLSAFNADLNDVVKQGDVIGYVGSSGMSTGPHLHYEVIKNGERVDPETYFK